MSTPAKTVARSQLEGHRMIDGNEYLYPVVIDNSNRWRWVAFGWIYEGPATEQDRELYAVVVEDVP